MPHPYYPTGTPRFNHVAMSLPAELLDEHNRADICHFWSEVFGFDEIEVLTEDRPDLDVALEEWNAKEGLLAAIFIDFLRRAERRG